MSITAINRTSLNEAVNDARRELAQVRLAKQEAYVKYIESLDKALSWEGFDRNHYFQNEDRIRFAAGNPHVATKLRALSEWGTACRTERSIEQLLKDHTALLEAVRAGMEKKP